MSSKPEPSYLRQIAPALPTEIASKVRSLCAQPTNVPILENFVRLLVGVKYSSDASPRMREQWRENQTLIRTIVDELRPTPTHRKRMWIDDDMDIAEDHVSPKRQRTVPNGEPSQNGSAHAAQQQEPDAPLFTLHSVSTTSPIRKKVDITVYQKALVFVNPSTKLPEATIPLSNLKRAFVLPTRGKSKPHWTVILLSSDVPNNPKAKAVPGAAPSENQQVVFGLDANTTANFMTSSYEKGEAVQETHPKNTSTIPLIDAFLSHSSIPVIRPSASTFKSACGGALAGSSASTDGIPGVEAYRAAKSGNLWFSEEGILWGESKPCEFWSVKDLISRDEGVRIVGAGRSCTVVLARRIGGVAVASGDNDADEDEEMGEETEFAMIDAKEREPISTWVRNHRDSFGGAVGRDKGKEKAGTKPKPSNNGPVTIHNLPDESDDDDDAFEIDNASELDGSERSSDSEDGSEDEKGAASEEEGAGGSGSGSGDDAEGSDDEVEELDPAHHPLLRPGAMPRMSRAALNMAAAIVEDAVTGGGGADGDDELEDEDDELDDWHDFAPKSVA